MFYSSVKSRGSKFIFNLIQSNVKNGTPFLHVIYTIIIEWVDNSNYSKNCDTKDKIIELSGLPPLIPSDFSSFVFVDVESSNWVVKSIKR
ncbi:hypothetical protein H5410_004572 [Solanum commersonii]|uniref:Uncharacterized protein n=1 Tax=Solanum commersonii TaxID=4109 RepID=A0A9J6B8S7_SOLCO|nr:hypothetical protein H5410_004572 [Solanum commersonii]